MNRAYTCGIPITCGTDATLNAGDEMELPLLDGRRIRARVIKEVSRQQHVDWTDALNQLRRALGHAPGHTGTFNTVTREYMPGLSPHPQVQHFYWLEVIEE